MKMKTYSLLNVICALNDAGAEIDTSKVDFENSTDRVIIIYEED